MRHGCSSWPFAAHPDPLCLWVRWRDPILFSLNFGDIGVGKGLVTRHGHDQQQFRHMICSCDNGQEAEGCNTGLLYVRVRMQALVA